MRLSITFLAMMGVASVAMGQMSTFSLGTVGGTGTLYVTNVNNEVQEPNSSMGKPIEYPYYWDAGQNLWVVIVAEQLSEDYNYVYEQENFTVLNKVGTDGDFGTFSFGELAWSSSALTGVGVEILSTMDFAFTLDLSDFAPLTSPRNFNNEFSWNYAGVVGGLTGAGLTFLDGQLISIDFQADISITPQLAGNPSLAFGTSYDGSVSFVGDSFAFAVDVTQDNTSFLGALTGTHLVFDTAGTVTGVVPEPGTASLVVAALLAAGWRSHRVALRTGRV